MRRGIQALAIPGVGVLTLVAAVALTHRDTRPPRVVRPTPSPIAVPATPQPTDFQQLFLIPDDFRLLSPHAYGTITAPRAAIPSGETFDITVGAAPQGLPNALPVWKLTPANVEPSAVAARFGLPAQPDADNAGLLVWSSGLSFDPEHSDITWLAMSGAPNPRLDSVPRDNLTAGVIAEEWLRRTGLFPTTMNAPQVHQTANGESASFSEWTVTWPRMAPEYPKFTIDNTVARISADGTLKELHASRAMIDKGSLYALRPWQDALADARRGVWYRAPLSTTGTLITSATISITYAVVGSYAVPMYELDAGGGLTPGLVPALAP